MGTAFSVIVLRYKQPYSNLHRPYKVPFIIPIIITIMCVYLVIAPVIDDPVIGWLYATIAVFSGLFFYLPSWNGIFRQIFGVDTEKILESFILCVQYLLKVAPNEK